MDRGLQDSRPVDAVLFLLGDAGAATEQRDVVLAHLAEAVAGEADRGIPVGVGFLGDNVYQVGARSRNESEDKPKVAAQVAVLDRRATVRGIFIPGNHDWGGGASSVVGRERLITQRAWIEELADGRNAALLPSDGCPGPVPIELGHSTLLLLLDTEALLRGETADCDGEDGAYSRLGAALEADGSRHVVVLGHHPLVSGGKHGGHLSVLSRVPTLSFLAAKAGVELQDVTSVHYSRMIERLVETFSSSDNPPIVYASGHEHSLQVIRTDWSDAAPTYQLVSGSVAKSSSVRRLDGTRFASDQPGYLRLDVRPDAIQLTAFGSPSRGAPLQHLFTCSLGTSAGSECAEAPLASPGR